MWIDHLGIATDDTAALLDLYTGVFEATVVHEEEREGLAVTFLGFDGDAGYLELLEPITDSEGPIPRYLDRHGPGIHHLALGVDDVEAAVATAADRGLDLIDGTPRPGAWDSRIAFVHPGSTGGVLIELVER